jgi:hypothetical protein
MKLLIPEFSLKPVSDYLLKTVERRGSSVFWLKDKSFEAECERLKPLERNERVFKG